MFLDGDSGVILVSCHFAFFMPYFVLLELSNDRDCFAVLNLFGRVSSSSLGL